MTDHPFPPGAALAAYLRDSGGDEQDLSTIQQESQIRAWCKQRGLYLARVFADAARPGSSTVGREQFHAMMEHFRNGATEAGIIIWRSNRLGRNVNDAQFHKADLRRRGYIVHSMMDDIPEGPAGQLVEFVLDWKDQVFLDQLSEDVKRGLRHNVEAYGTLPGSPPRGFRRSAVHIGQRRDGSERIGYRWEPDPETAPLVLRAFEMRAQGIGLKQIQSQIPLYKSTNCWATFFDNELYTGVLHYGGVTIRDYCPAIVPAEIWNAVQARRRVASVFSNPRRKISQVFLSGLIYCQVCGHPMNIRYITGKRYYTCSYRKRTGECDARHIPAQAADDELTRIVQTHILVPQNALELQRRMLAQTPEKLADDKRTLRLAQGEHAKHKREIANLVAAIRAAGHSPALLSELAALEETEQTIRVHIEHLKEQIQPAETIPEKELSAYIQQQRAALANPQTARAVIKSLIRIIRARRDDATVILQIDYMPPHLGARQGRAPISAIEGDPLGALSVALITTIQVRPRKAPRRK
jgi:site-specific DNA recombinase